MSWTIWMAVAVVIATIWALVKRLETRLVLLVAGGKVDVGSGGLDGSELVGALDGLRLDGSLLDLGVLVLAHVCSLGLEGACARTASTGCWRRASAAP